MTTKSPYFLDLEVKAPNNSGVRKQQWLFFGTLSASNLSPMETSLLKPPPLLNYNGRDSVKGQSLKSSGHF